MNGYRMQEPGCRCRRPAAGGEVRGTSGAAPAARGFTLLELMAVAMIILILTAAVGLTLGNSRPSVQVKRDAAQTVSFLRNMWDRARATGGSLVLEPDFEKGTLDYTDPRTGKRTRAEFDSDAHVIAIGLNDRFYNAWSHLTRVPQGEDDAEYDPEADVLYISEGRGLVRVSVVFGIPVEEESIEGQLMVYDKVTMCTLNLVNGKGKIELLEEGNLDDILAPRLEEDDYE